MYNFSISFLFNLIKFLCFIDLSIDVSKIGTDQANELNSTAHGFGMTTNDFYSFLNNDLEEAENIQLARLAEEEKAMFAVNDNLSTYIICIFICTKYYLLEFL